MEYRVRWEIDVDGDTPREAAEKALEIQRDQLSTATVFQVEVGEEEWEEIDLGASVKPVDGKCPRCGSEEIEGGFVGIEGRLAVQENCGCLSCGAHWHDVYALVDNVMDEEGDEDETRFHNFYRCECGKEWEGYWSCACNDECPACGIHEIEPYKYEEKDEEGNYHE